MTTDYSKWAVPCLIREIGRKWPGAGAQTRLFIAMKEEEGFMEKGHTRITAGCVRNFLGLSIAWNTKEAQELKKHLRERVNAWLVEQRKVNYHADPRNV